MPDTEKVKGTRGGWRGGGRPKKGRTAALNIRILPTARDCLDARAASNGCTITDLIEDFALTTPPANEKPVFVPLKKEWFLKFAEGEKTVEYRDYGPRWNERVCRVGRAATLSCGYSGSRLSARISAFRRNGMTAEIEMMNIRPVNGR